jgi:hypothetical protein
LACEQAENIELTVNKAKPHAASVLKRILMSPSFST